MGTAAVARIVHHPPMKNGERSRHAISAEIRTVFVISAQAESIAMI
jgi:hypothetical protein